MGENNNNESRPEPSSRRDGNIDFSRYATPQLEELRDSLDPAASPLNHAALLAELARRATSIPQAPRWEGRFTQRSGLLGWLSAKLRRSPLYGEGTVETSADHLILQGRQRTWLGFGIERALYVPLQRVRNTIVTAKGLRFQVSRKGWLARNIEFLPVHAMDSEAIARALPQTRTAKFGKYGASLLAFEEQLHARCPVAWLTPLLVLLNIAVFVAMWIQAGGLAGIVDTPLALLAANIGPLTLEGQWWRLLSAIFVHADLWHLSLNLWVLWNVGRLSERLYGRWTFLTLYLGCGLFASLSSLLWDPARGTVGASGAIFALFGAFLAHLLRHRRAVPRGIFHSHWIPTLLFVAFSLYNGARAVDVDNAAHVGGLLCGFAMGLMLSRSVDTGTGNALRLRWAPALTVYLLCAGGALSYVFWTRGPTPVGQQFAARHAWYISGEAKSTAAWRQLAGAAGAGVISDEDLGARIGKEVLPFWKEATPKLEAEVSSLRGEEQRYVRVISRFARLRLEWAEAVIDATSGRDPQKMAVARRKDDEAQTEVARIERLGARSSAARMTGGLVNLPPVQRLRSRLGSGADRCVEAPPAYRVDFPVADTDLSTDSPAMLKKLGCQAQEHFRSGDFKALDAMFADGATHVGDLAAGASTLNGVFAGVSDLMEYGEGSIEQYLRQLAMWRRAVPDSYYPDLMEAEMYHLWAWAARGHGTVTQVTQQAWALFSYRNDMAQAALDDSPEQAQKDPLWCYKTMRLQHDLAHALEPLEQTFRTCIDRFPGYMALYGSMLRALMPRWFGSYEKVAEFIEKTSAAAPEGERNALYAHLYWIYADLERDEVNILHDPGAADWTRLHDGFEALKEKYPKSDLVLNAHARFACLAQDELIYRHLRRGLLGHRSATAWTKITTSEKCDAEYATW
jgi:membrane associated rhomboid family serine protease